MPLETRTCEECGRTLELPNFFDEKKYLTDKCVTCRRPPVHLAPLQRVPKKSHTGRKLKECQDCKSMHDISSFISYSGRETNFCYACRSKFKEWYRRHPGADFKGKSYRSRFDKR